MFLYVLKFLFFFLNQASYNFMNLAQEEAKEGIQQDIKSLLETCPADKKDVSLCCRN